MFLHSHFCHCDFMTWNKVSLQHDSLTDTPICTSPGTRRLRTQGAERAGCEQRGQEQEPDQGCVTELATAVHPWSCRMFWGALQNTSQTFLGMREDPSTVIQAGPCGAQHPHTSGWCTQDCRVGSWVSHAATSERLWLRSTDYMACGWGNMLSVCTCAELFEHESPSVERLSCG